MAGGGLSRRSFLTGAAVAVVGGIAGYLVATNSSAARAPATAGGGASGPNGYGAAPAGGGARLVAASKVPAGGGVVLAADGVVVTRGSDGSLHAFSSVCTHQGCTVGSVSGGRITCPCHGSQFDASTGAVVNGPADRPLPAVAVEERGGDVYRV